MVAGIGISIHAFGQGAVQIDNSLAAGYLDIYWSGNHYTGPFGFELWYKNSTAAEDPTINSLNGVNPAMALHFLRLIASFKQLTLTPVSLAPLPMAGLSPGWAR